MENQNTKINIKPHQFTLENRKKASMSGIQCVVNSSEVAVNLITSDGALSIFGKELKIEKFNIEEQTLVVGGLIDSLKYEQVKAPLLKRLFK